MALMKDGLWGIVNGSDTLPTDSSADKESKFKARKDRALAIIVLSIDSSLLYLLGDPKDPIAVWTALSNQFQKKSWANRLALRRKLHSVRLREGDSVQDHVKVMTELFNELSIVGDKIEDDDRVIYLLASLPESFNVLVTALEASQDVPSMENVIERLHHEELKQKERRSSGGTPKEEAMTMRHGNKKRGPQCHYCKRFGHIKRNCRDYHRESGETDSRTQHGQSKFDKSLKPVNHRSNGKNHKVNCVKTEDGSDSDEVGLVVRHALAVKANLKGCEWVVDSGATSHICNNKGQFVQLFPLQEPIKITLGDGHTLTATAVGTVKLRVWYSQQRSRKCFLSDVLYVPELSYNLLSVPKVVEKGNKVNFVDSKCIIRDGKQKVVAVATKHEGLYYVSTDATERINVVNNSSLVSRPHVTNEDIWHYRYGHLNMKSLQKLAHDDLVGGYDYNPSKEIQFCESCLEGKQHRNPFPSHSTNRAKEVLELVHTDVCGKLNSKSLSGREYFLTFVDDYSRYVWIYVLKNKSDVFKRFIEWKSLTEQLTGKSVKKIRSDNGGEYTSTEFTEYFKREGIEHQLTIPKSPEQNGVAERQNRTLMEMVRSMLSSSKLPPRFWAEALSTAAYLRNRSPTKAVRENKTSFEMLMGRKPKVEHLRIFGCAAYCHIPDDERHKLDPKSRKCIFLGYSENRKGYRLYDIERQKIIHSRDIVFNESTTGFEETLPQKRFIVELNTESEELNELPTPVHNADSAEESNEDQVENEHGCTENTVSGPRRSTRISRRPNYYGVYINTAICHAEPVTLKEALEGDDRKQWKDAMEAEVSSLKSNKVWELVKLPNDARIVNCKWVFRKKLNANGEIDRYKARLVAQGYSQRHGLDYDETFSPVVRFESLRIVLALSAQLNLKVHQMDIKTAFLNGELNDLIYMRQPDGFVIKGQEGLVCKLNRSIYGLKQSPRCWNSSIDNHLKKIGFVQSNSDPCIYVANEGEMFLIAIYVDDILLAGLTDERIVEVKKALSSRYDIKDMGPINSFLGVKIVQNQKDGTIWAGQPLYTEHTLKEFEMNNAKPTKTPVNTSLKLTKASEDSECVDQELYQSAVGKLLYLSTRTRPDITFAVSAVARYTSQPTTEHWKAVKQIFRYLVGTVNHGIQFSRSESDECVGYSDADFAGDLDDRKSTSGVIYKIGGGPVSWCSRKQTNVALSTSEAEYVALSMAAQEGIWIRQLMSELLDHLQSKSLLTRITNLQYVCQKIPNFMDAASIYLSNIISFVIV